MEDLAQYPIMPWTYVDFTSSNIDLGDVNRYRDLRLPIGAINDACLKTLQERLKEVMDIHTFRGESDAKRKGSEILIVR